MGAGPICPLIDYALGPKPAVAAAVTSDKINTYQIGVTPRRESDQAAPLSRPSGSARLIGYLVAAPVLIGIVVVTGLSLAFMYAIAAAISFGRLIFVVSLLIHVASDRCAALRRWFIWTGAGVIIACLYSFIAPIDVVQICSSTPLVGRVGIALSGAMAGLIMNLGLRSTRQSA
jgi:hypothetical protein